ncbi:unannotated protein [freshwater metagenome]|uniref:Unannotated protein n=1 Tax=freshwater metagenome TaxID=449393 RepID=A0A6J7GDA4_9ZZZZ
MWTEVEPSQFPWEQEALSFLKAGIPDHEPYRAWSNFEFIAENGSINEVDALVVTTRGLFLVEIKSHPGVITGDAARWTWTRENGSKKPFENPYILVNRKAKKLKSLLERQPAFRNDTVPFVTPLVFLSSPDLDCRLHAPGRAHVTGRDDLEAKTAFPLLPGVICTLKDPSIANIIGTAINTPLSKRIADALGQLGIRATSKHRRLGDWNLGALLDEGEGWQDFEATHPVGKTKKRARIYLARRAHTAAEADQLRRAAEREYRLLEGVRHPGIAQPVDLQQHEYGPALTFELVAGEERLDLWAEIELKSLDLYARLELVRDLAEALDYAHRHQLSHRALVPRNVIVRPPIPVPGIGAARPRLVISNWQFAMRSASTELSRIGATAVDPTGQMTDADAVYIAPEIGSAAEPDGERADMFSLGALTYLLLAGRPPASTMAERNILLQTDSCLLLEKGFDGAPQSLVELVAFATQAVADQRLDSVQELLKLLDDALAELTEPENAETLDPLSANKGDLLDGGWAVVRRLGSGSTATALLAQRNGAYEVLKVALDEANAPRLAAEERALGKLRHFGIVECFGIERVGGRTALRLAPAVDVRSDDPDTGQTLAERIAEQGKLSLDLLQRFGDDLLEVVAILENEGIAHRDIKPDNLGVRMRGKNNELHLVLFDFSLSSAPVEHTRAGTPRYLDPFLDERRPPRWDIAAERYAASVTLYQMATGVLPRWGDGTSDPLLLTDTLPQLEVDLFEPALRDDLLAYFQQALQRDPTRRFDTAPQMRTAWRSIFERATSTTGTNDVALSEGELERLASIASPDTPINELGLSLGALSVLERRGTATAGDLVQLPLNDLTTMRGVGHRLRQELRAAVRRLSPYVTALADESDARSIDGLLQLCLPKGASPAVEADRPPTEALLGLDDEPSGGAWPTLVAIASRFGLDRADADELLDRARKRWLRHQALTSVRDDIAALLDTNGGIATGDEVALLLLAQRGSSKTGDERLHRGRAVVRAAIEAEQGRTTTRFTYRRLGTTIVLASHSGMRDAQELTDYASSLGPIADDLAAADPLAAPNVVIERLRAVEPPFGLEPLSDTRLVRLAAASSPRAAVSSRLELYPRGMPADRALTLARAALLGVGTLSEEQVRDRVRARFPEAAPLPPRPELDAPLKNLVGLEWFTDPVRAQAGFRVPPPPNASPTSSMFGGHNTRYRTGTSTLVPSDEVRTALDAEDRLQRSLAGGGFLVLTVSKDRLLLAERVLREQFVVEPFDAEASVIDEMRRIAIEKRAKWDTGIIAADAGGESGQHWDRLRQIARSAADATEAALLSHRDVLVTRTGLLARYGLLTPMLDRLRNRTTVTVDRSQTLRTLWVLVAADDPSARPSVDGTIIPIVNGSEWMVLPEAWLKNAHKIEPGAA